MWESRKGFQQSTVTCDSIWIILFWNFYRRGIKGEKSELRICFNYPQRRCAQTRDTMAAEVVRRQ